MSGLEDQLQLDITEALAQVERLDQAFAAAGATLQNAVDSALTGLTDVPPAEIVVEPDVTDVAPAVEDALNAADSTIVVEGDTGTLTSDVTGAIDSVDSTVEVTGDTHELKAAIDALSGESVEVDVQAPGLDQIGTDLANAGTAADHAGTAAHGAAGEFGALAVGAKLAAGETGALTEGLHLIPAAGAVGAITAVAVAGKELFGSALAARSAQERYNLVLGDFAEVVDTIDVGGLNENIDHLAVRLGSTGKDLENAASKIFTIGNAAGKAGPQIAQTTEQVIALASRAVALNPALGNVGDVAERLFNGLSRGGRFAANFGISLTSAEIATRALADTGKTATSQLTLYEKAAAGAELATERLGTHLSEDINAGAENVRTKLASVKARFEEALETLGQPLLDPIIASITDAEPALESLASTFAHVFTAVAPLIEAIASGLAPAVDALLTPFNLLADILTPISDALGALPSFLTAGAVAAGLAAIAVSRLAASSGLLASAIGLTGLSLTGLTAVLPTVALGIGAVVTVMQLLKQHTKEVNEAAQKLLVDPATNALNAATSFGQVDAVIGAIKTSIDDLNDSAAAKTGGPLGFFRQVDAKDLQVGADALSQTEVNATRLRIAAKELQRELHLTDEQALALARSGGTVGDRFDETTGKFDNVTSAVQAQTDALAKYEDEVRAGVFTQQEYAQALADTQLTADDLGNALAEARKPVDDFAQAIVDGLPNVASAFTNLDDANVSLKAFLSGAEEAVANSAAFLGNIQQLIDRGATALATSFAELDKQDPTKAAKLAKEAVGLTADALNEANTKLTQINFGEGLVSAAATHIAEETKGGGIDLAVDKIREQIGTRMALIPGQLDNTLKTTAKTTVTSSINAILGTDALTEFPDDMHDIGVQGGSGLSQGISDGVDLGVNKILVEQAANKVINTVRKAFQISSPSKVMIELGQLVAEGFAIGLADISGAADAIDPILKVMDQFKLTAIDVSTVAGNNIGEITKNLEALGAAQSKLTPDQLLKVGDAVKALGGQKGVKELQTALAQQVSAAFGGLGGKEIAGIVDQINTAAALQRAQGVFGITPVAPTPFETNVVKGGDVTAGNRPPIQQNITVTPPADATPAEIAGEIAIASQWAFAGVSG